MLIAIDNLNYPYHFEVIETFILKYDYILKIAKNNSIVISLENIRSNDYINYIKNKYPNILINQNKNYNYKIYTTFYSNFESKFQKQLNSNKYYFISHDISPNLFKYNNVFFLTPLCNLPKRFIYAKYLPDISIFKKSNVNYPIYVIQGNFTDKRRNYRLLNNILKHNYPYDFKFKFIGRGKFPEILEKYKSNIIIENNLNFINYHKAFENTYCILPLITKQSHPQYYKNKLTSTISYALGYNLKCLIDKDLQKIYNLPNVEIFNNENDISKAFLRTLEIFYKK